MPKARTPQTGLDKAAEPEAKVTAPAQPGSSRQQVLWRGAAGIAGAAYGLIVKLPLILTIVVIAGLLIQSVFQRTTAIEPISVPKVLSDGGYTSEIAAQRLRDALLQFALTTTTHMKSSNIALRGELPSIVVPTVGLSLDTIASAIRTFLGSSYRRSISGEFIVKEGLLWLRVRVDGLECYTSVNGSHLEKPDDLLAEAAPKILDVIQPYFVAASYVYTDPAKAFNGANDIIARLPESDENVAWAYVLKGRLYSDRKDYANATDAYQKALRLDPGLAVALVGLGGAQAEQGRPEDAEKAYRKAIKLAPRMPHAHVALGTLLEAKGDDDSAIAAYRAAIGVDPKYALAYYNLGGRLNKKGRHEEAVTAYRNAIRLDPKDARFRNNLGSALLSLGKNEEAVTAFSEAISLDPKLAVAHFGLGNALLLSDRKDEAIAAYREATRIDPGHANAYNNLGVLLREQSRRDEAIAAFRAAITAYPDHEVARANLEGLLRAPGPPGDVDQK
jgi:tetratricopeptide (TPR) repeat protein